jgi:predicted nucleotidyltransferase
MTSAQRFEEILELALSDDAILGLILYGSRAADMFVRDDSDWDLWLIVGDEVFTDYEA